MRVRGERFRGGGSRRLVAIAFAAATIACGPKLSVTTRPDADAARALFVGPPDSWIRISVARGDGQIVEEIYGEPRVAEGYGPYVEGRIADPVLSPDGGRIATAWGNMLFFVGVGVLVALTRAPSRLRPVLLGIALYILAFVWETRMSQEPSVTRLLLVGAILVIMMNYRPQGIFGQRRVEVV